MKKHYKEINLLEIENALNLTYQDNYKEDIIDLYKEIAKKLFHSNRGK